jgi:hypothetical protein
MYRFILESVLTDAWLYVRIIAIEMELAIESFWIHVTTEYVDVFVTHPQSNLHGSEDRRATNMYTFGRIPAESFAVDVLELHGLLLLFLDGGTVEYVTAVR